MAKSDLVAQAIGFFVRDGWSKVAAAGIVGNLLHESGLRTNAVGDSGKAKGIAQWHPDRWAGLEEFAASKGLSPSDLEAQLGYVSHELRTSEKRAGKALMQATNAEEATGAMLGFERPKGFSWDDPTKSLGYNARLAGAQRALGIDPTSIANIPERMASQEVGQPGPKIEVPQMAPPTEEGGTEKMFQPIPYRPIGFDKMSQMFGLNSRERPADGGFLGSFSRGFGAGINTGLMFSRRGRSQWPA